MKVIATTPPFHNDAHDLNIKNSRNFLLQHDEKFFICFYRKLHCPRNTLHMHLFVSFILRAFMTLLKNWLFVHGVGLPSDVLGEEELEYFVINLQSVNILFFHHFVLLLQILFFY